MFSGILGRKKEEISEENAEHTALVEKISKMNLTEMRSYIKNKIQDLDVSEDGLNIVMRRLIEKDTKSKKYYLKVDDMDSKKKKAFDLVLSIAQNKKVNLTTIELIQKFMEIYKTIIIEYDKKHKEIYSSRFLDAVNSALASINHKVTLNNKMNILGNN